jgi:AraC-like DNA-binding protein
MAMPAHATGYARFVTDPARRRRDSAEYIDLLRRMIINFETMADDFFTDSTLVSLPGVRIINSHSSGYRSERRGAMVHESDDLALYLCLQGGARISHRGEDIVLKAGESTLLSSTECLRIERGRSRQIVIAVPRKSLTKAGASADASVMRKLDPAVQPLNLLRAYVEAFTGNPELAGPDYRSVTAAQIQDLMAVALGATHRAAERAEGRGVRAARMQALKADIAANLAASDLSATALAARHRISRRYIHALFEHEGTTLSRFVTEQRLAQVQRALADPSQSHLTIGAIAFDTGFNDLSGFNHAFKRRFGMTPREYRVLQQRPDVA